MKQVILGLMLVLAACAKKQEEPQPYVCTETMPAANGKPTVLVIGDSITIGYFPYIKQALEQNYDVIHNPCNAGNTTYLLNHLDEWLASRPHFAAIIFDVGLHDIYRWEWNDENVFLSNLKDIGLKIQLKTDYVAYQNMTQVNNSTPGDFLISQVVPRNQDAGQLMNSINIPVIDLYSVSLNLPPDKPCSPHYTEAGYQTLANSVLSTLNAANIK